VHCTAQTLCKLKAVLLTNVIVLYVIHEDYFYCLLLKRFLCLFLPITKNVLLAEAK